MEEVRKPYMTHSMTRFHRDIFNEERIGKSMRIYEYMESETNGSLMLVQLNAHNFSWQRDRSTCKLHYDDDEVITQIK